MLGVSLGVWKACDVGVPEDLGVLGDPGRELKCSETLRVTLIGSLASDAFVWKYFRNFPSEVNFDARGVEGVCGSGGAASGRLAGVCGIGETFGAGCMGSAGLTCFICSAVRGITVSGVEALARLAEGWASKDLSRDFASALSRSSWSGVGCGRLSAGMSSILGRMLNGGNPASGIGAGESSLRSRSLRRCPLVWAVGSGFGLGRGGSGGSSSPLEPFSSSSELLSLSAIHVSFGILMSLRSPDRERVSRVGVGSDKVERSSKGNLRDSVSEVFTYPP